MSEFTFGEYGEESGLGPAAQEPQAREPKWFRERMDKVSDELKALRARNEALETEKRRAEVAESLKAKGYVPSGAKLYAGDPKELNGWLEANGDALAKLPTEGEALAGQHQAPAGPPASVVSPESQAALQRMQAAGAENVAPPAGSDAEMASRIDSMNQDQFAEFMRSQGNRHYR